MQIYIILLLTFITKQATYTRSSCLNNQIFNPFTLSCISCPANMRPNPSQAFPTSCICNVGYFPTYPSSCQYLGSSSSLNCSNNQFFDVISNSGSFQTPGSTYNCSLCSSNAYANTNGTGCVLCPRNMVFSSAQGTCSCINSSLTYTPQGCFTPAQVASSSNLGMSSSTYYNNLKYLFPYCAYFKDLLSCSQIVNLCIFSMAYGDATNQAQCKFFTQLTSFQYYLQVDTSVKQFYISPGQFQKHDEMKMKILYYLPTGNFVKEKDLKLTDIFRCGLPSNNSVAINIGDNIQVSCSFNFDYLVQQSQSKTYKNYLYELLVMGQSNQYFPVTVNIGASTVPVKRFLLEDTLTSPTYINILNSLKLVFSLNSTGYLVSPKLTVTYKKLSIQNAAITPTADKYQTIIYQIKFVYKLQTFWSSFIGIFVTINVLVLIQTIIRTYISHLNKQSVLNFFYYFGNFWSIWMFYFLLGISGYWFLFCKTTQNAYLFIPDSSSDSFYVAFFIIAGIMGIFRIIIVFVDKKDKINNQVFIVNKEPNQRQENCWKQIFIVNSLAQFYTHRTISFFWMLLVSLFFLVGLKWQNHASQVSHTNLDSIYYFNPVNRVHLYFLGSAVLLTIGIVFKILRRIIIIQWPYPFEDFVDYCYVTNISLLFMKKRSREAYFVHASISGQTEVSFKQINQAIKKGIQKNRQILNQHNLHGNQGLYILYISQDWYDKFHNMIKKIEDQQNQQLVKNIKSTKNKKYINPRQQFIKHKIKDDLDKISSQHYSNSNSQISSRSLLRRFIGLPQQSFYNIKQPRIVRDDYSDLVSEVFPNGNQFEQIHTIIILFLMFLLMTANVCAAAFLTYFISQYIIDGWISNSCRARLEKMTRVREGFML